MAAEMLEETPELKRLVERVALSDAVVCSQQRGDPELSVEQRYEHIKSLFYKNRSSFLSRFGSFLLEEDLVCFDKDNFEEKFYLNSIRKNFNPQYARRVVRNRRNECMRQLIEDGEYFDHRAMSMRDPLLYEHYIGQYMTEEERQAMELEEEPGQCALSAMIMFQMQQERRSRLLAKQREHEHEEEIIHGMDKLVLPGHAKQHQPQPPHEVVSETDDDAEISQATWGEVVEDKPAKSKVNAGLGSEERLLLYQEFVSLMQQSFLDGKDKDFDYSSVDNNAEYDNLETRRHDEEEQYFEAEEPEECLADEEDLAWLRSVAAERSALKVSDFEEEFDEDEDDEDMDAS